MIEKARGTIESNGWFIVGYHFAGYTRLVGPPAAGMFRVPYRRWALLDHIGGTLWVLAFTLLGVVLGLFGLDFGDTRRMSRFLEFFFTALIISGIAIAWYRTSRTAAATPADPEVAREQL
jgi:membrane protein DedA with SNARE-associated domain